MSSGQYKIRRRELKSHDGPTVSGRAEFGLRAPSSAHLSEIRGSLMRKAGVLAFTGAGGGLIHSLASALDGDGVLKDLPDLASVAFPVRSCDWVLATMRHRTSRPVGLTFAELPEELRAWWQQDNPKVEKIWGGEHNAPQILAFVVPHKGDLPDFTPVALCCDSLLGNAGVLAFAGPGGGLKCLQEEGTHFSQHSRCDSDSPQCEERWSLCLQAKGPHKQRSRCAPDSPSCEER